MNYRTLWIVSLLLLLLPSACSKQPAQPTNPEAGGGNTSVPADAGDAHADDHGDPHVLGKLSAFGRTFEVIQMGDIEPGHEGAVELAFASGEQRITTIRAWLGSEDARGSMKSRLMIEGEAAMHGHIEVPDPIPAGSRLWFECEVDGNSETVSIDFQR